MKKDERIEMRVTNGLKKEIKLVAKKLGLNVSSYLINLHKKYIIDESL